MLSKVLISEMTSPEFAEAIQQENTILIPVGSTEVLGTHEPLGTDYFVAADLVESALSPTGHGGEEITSVVMALKPELVDIS